MLLLDSAALQSRRKVFPHSDSNPRGNKEKDWYNRLNQGKKIYTKKTIIRGKRQMTNWGKTVKC